MPQERIKKIHLVYGCITAVLIVALGIALILSCLDIYNSGYQPYTPTSIGSHFQKISMLAYACIAVVLGGIILRLVVPTDQSKPKPVKDEKAIMEKAKITAINLNADTSASAKKEQKLRLMLRIGAAVIFTALMVYPAIYFFDETHFNDEIIKTSEICIAVCIALVPSLVGLLLCFICAELERKSISRETEIYKSAAKSAAGPKEAASPVAPQKITNTILFVRCAVLAVAVCFIVLGIFNGGMKDVFDKAVAICTECIGLG